MTLEEQVACQEDWFNRFDYYCEAGFADPDLFPDCEPPYIKGVTVITMQVHQPRPERDGD